MSILAVDGGIPVCTDTDWGRHLIGEEEREAVMNLFDESLHKGSAFDRYSGEHVDAYEKEFAAYIGCKHATAVSSGTAAIHAALSALRLEPGTEVICSPITDPGAVSPVVLNLCIPVFADTLPGTFNINREGVEKVISGRTGAIVAGHIAGEPADMEPIAELGRERGIPVIEDCAQAHGAEYRGKLAGTLSDAAAFSMMSGKHHTSGGQGGMVVTDDNELCVNAKRFADRGKPFGSDETTNLFAGLNYRMTELEAVIGRVQLKKLPAFIAGRSKLVDHLADRISGLESVSLGRILEDTKPVYWFLRIHVDESKLKVTKEQFAEALEAEGIPSAPTYTSIIYIQKWFKEKQVFGTSGLPWSLPGNDRDIVYEGSCPNAEEALASHLMISLNESYTEKHMDMIAEALGKVEKAYLR